MTEANTISKKYEISFERKHLETAMIVDVLNRLQKNCDILLRMFSPSNLRLYDYKLPMTGEEIAILQTAIKHTKYINQLQARGVIKLENTTPIDKQILNEFYGLNDEKINKVLQKLQVINN
ncbi:MAG: hypothetical protein WC707_06860 [Candidatus Babeliaceae bacterium]|jgi:hypothetical protein